MSDQFPEFFVRLDTFSSAVWYRTRRGRYRLEGTRCANCDTKFFPPRTGLICPVCYAREMVPYECAHTGTLVAVAQDNLGFPAWGYGDDLPRVMVIVRLDDGVHVMGDVVEFEEPEAVEPGARVKMVLRKHRREDTGAWVYGYRFVLADL
ncbi:MAG: OB-fold domain-containing protein [Anaerolineae bacterium]|nr:OB-fold domain-containing protein [Anaerolineae bacterium]